MKNNKKVLSVALAGALAFGSMGAAFAAMPEMNEGTDKNIVEAVKRLNAFGIINGMDDGKYHEEMKVTREQFAKILVEALGLGNAASAANGSTNFSDVEGSRWSSGYINVAVGQGILKGYPDGTFKPAQEVSYAEAVTMLVRALGYKDEFLAGSWPGNYVAKAAELDITDDVDFSVTGTADRGASAVLVDNTLDAKVIKQNSFGDENSWTESDKTLLEEKLDITKIEDATIEAVAKVDSSLDADEIKVDGKVYEVSGEIDTTNLLGLETILYVNDDEVVYVDVETEDKDMLTGTITEINGNEITVQFADGTDKEIDLATEVTKYVDNKKSTDPLTTGLYGRVVLNDDGDVSFVDAIDLSGEEAVIVKEINSDKKYIKGLKGTIDNSKVDVDEEDGYKIFLNGKQVGFDAIKTGDLVYSKNVTELDGDTYTYVYVVRNAVEGKLERVKMNEFTVAGKAYDVNTADITYSLDNDDEIKDFANSEDLEDASGETVKIYLDINGEVRHITTSVEETSDSQYAVVTKDGFLVSGDDAVKLFNQEGKEVTYTFDEDQSGVTQGDIVKYELDKDGKVDTDNYSVIADSADITVGADAGEITIASFDDEKDYMLDSNGNKIYIAEDTVIMSYYDGADIDPSMVTWDDIKDKTPGADLRAVVVMDEDGIDAELVVFTDNYDLSADGNSGYVKDDVYYDGDYKVDVVLANGEEKTFVVDASKKDSMKEGDFVVFSTNEDGEIDNVVKAVYDNSAATSGDLQAIDVDYTIATGAVTKFQNNVIVLASGSHKITSDVPVFVLTLDGGEYDTIEAGDVSDIEEGTTVRVIINDGDVEMIVVVEE